jgi:hypothetical protein
MPALASHKALQSKFSPGLELQERVLGHASFSLSFFLQPVKTPPSSVRLYLNSQQGCRSLALLHSAIVRMFIPDSPGVEPRPKKIFN